MIPNMSMILKTCTRLDKHLSSGSKTKPVPQTAVKNTDNMSVWNKLEGLIQNTTADKTKGFQNCKLVKSQTIQINVDEVSSGHC